MLFELFASHFGYPDEVIEFGHIIFEFCPIWSPKACFPSNNRQDSWGLSW